MNLFKLVLFLIFNFSFLYAITYEDAENATTSQWKRVNSDAVSSINNVRDKMKKSRVIEFKGAGTKQIYALYTSDNKQGHEYWVSWDMKFSEDFVIILLVQSNLGKHYLIYTPGKHNSYMQYGLGEGITNGQWKTFRRNIQKDIAYFDNRVKIVSLKRFVVKGNGMIDNIKTTLGSQKKRAIKQTSKIKTSKIDTSHTRLNPDKEWIPEAKLMPPVEHPEVAKKSTNSAPVIKMKGMKIVKLRLGEPYVEQGVSAYDKEDGELEVETIENIYSNEAGRYMVLYMATDSDGNIAIDKRYVDVGDFKLEKRERVVERHEPQRVKEEKFSREELERGRLDNDEEEGLDEEDSELSKQAAQMRLWERRLEMREKELAKRRE
jgi:hypothetical protein